MLSTKFSITSHNCELNGFLLMPEGSGPHPIVILLHGFPGHQKNYDIAHELRLAGYNALIFSYRGSWGSKGSYAFQHVLEDSAAVIEHITTPAVARKYRINTDRIYIIGHSLGGWNALMTTAQCPQIRAAAALATFNLGYLAEKLQRETNFRDELIEKIEILGTDPLSGTSAEALADEIGAHHKIWDPRCHINGLLGRPLCLVGATNDVEAPLDVHHKSIIDALTAAGHKMLRAEIYNTDHGFSDMREKLISELIGWLDVLMH